MLCNAPVRLKSPAQDALFHFSCQYAARLPVHPPRPMLKRQHLMRRLMEDRVLCNVDGRPATSVAEVQLLMADFEMCHQVVTLWLWLSYRLDSRDQFVGRGIAEAEREEAQVRCGLSQGPLSCAMRTSCNCFSPLSWASTGFSSSRRERLCRCTSRMQLGAATQGGMAVVVAAHQGRLRE